MFEFPLVASSEEMRVGYINRLMSASGDVYDLEDLKSRCEAFIGLTEQFLALQPDQTYNFGEEIVFDTHALRLMLGRFQRDAFGVQRLWSKLDANVADEQLRKNVKEEIMDLGLRVGSNDPKKTRIAAVFSLWMATFRPVTIRWDASIKDLRAPKFCAALNFWIAQSYLSKFGEVLVGSEFREHINRILHDFTYREINLSSLEVLYCGIFRPDPSKA